MRRVDVDGWRAIRGALEQRVEGPIAARGVALRDHHHRLAASSSSGTLARCAAVVTTTFGCESSRMKRTSSRLSSELSETAIAPSFCVPR